MTKTNYNPAEDSGAVLIYAYSTLNPDTAVRPADLVQFLTEISQDWLTVFRGEVVESVRFEFSVNDSRRGSVREVDVYGYALMTPESCGECADARHDVEIDPRHESHERSEWFRLMRYEFRTAREFFEG